MGFAARNDGMGWRAVNSAADCTAIETYSDAQPILVPSLSLAQGQANAAIDAQAGATRLKYITDTPGQADTYTQKAADAAAYKAAGYPFANIASYPWTQAEAAAINGAAFTAVQAQAAADGILGMQATWVTKGASIEQARRAGKIAVGAASAVSAVQTAQAAAISALQAL